MSNDFKKVSKAIVTLDFGVIEIPIPYNFNDFCKNIGRNGVIWIDGVYYPMHRVECIKPIFD